MDEGFLKGQADNLPKIDSFMVAKYFSKNHDFMAAEMRGVKMQRSGREGYGDDAIGYVQIKRINDICTVKCRITPEHRVRRVPYHCTLTCNEKDEKILTVVCEDCAASQGGCKHAVAFVMWLHRRSEEPATTSTKCYWKKANLSGVGTSLKMIKARDFGPHKETVKKDDAFLNKIVPKLREHRVQCQLLHYYDDKNDLEKMSIHYLICTFRKKTTFVDVDAFLSFCTNEMTDAKCLEVLNASKAQANSKLWFEMRYGRVTASKAHEVAQCKTSDGVLVEEIFGAKSFKETAAISRGKTLENEVRNEVSRTRNIIITETGLILNNKLPTFGASPDGITDEYVIEIKCPFKAKNYNRYYNDGKIGNKYFAQIQLQMHMSTKEKGLFCIAHADFESTKKVDVYEVLYDTKYCESLIEKCMSFWKTNIFNKLMSQ